MVSRLATAIDGEKWMRQMRGTQQTRLIRSTADCVNGFMFEQKQFVRTRTIFSFFRDNFFLQREGARKFHSVEPTHAEIWRAELLRGRLDDARCCSQPGLAGTRP